jgi:hypothetical protein
VVQADADGDVCFTTLRDAALVVDVNGVSDIGIQSFPNRRVDTRTDSTAGTPGTTGTVPVWPPFTPGPAVDGVAALTGAPAGSDVTARPTLAVKIDNFGPARPQWALDEADVVFELNVEGVTRFLALFHTRMPTVLGPIRSARTADIELVAGMNRPIFAFSGANTGTTGWIESAASSGMLTPYSSLARPCYGREPSRPGPHNLLLDPACARSTVAGDPVQPGPARPLWAIDDDWEVPTGIGAVPATTPFDVAMDGVATTWTWDAATRTYPPLPGRPSAPRRVGAADRRSQRGAAPGGARAVAGRRTLAQPDHHRHGRRRARPRRRGDPGGLVTGEPGGTVPVLRPRRRGTGAARRGNHVRPGHPARLSCSGLGPAPSGPVPSHPDGRTPR